MRDLTKRRNSLVRDSKRNIPWAHMITNIQAKVLESLAVYKYLTLSQMLQLNVGTRDSRYIHRQVASLRDRRKPLVECSNYQSPQPRRGRVESMYYLTEEGERALINDLFYPENKIRRPVGKSQVYRDYYHRKYTIDFQIRLMKWCASKGKEVPLSEFYFDYSGNNRVGKNLTAQTRIDLEGDEYIIPDMSFTIRAPGKGDSFFLFEMHNGKDTGKLIRQIHQHAKALVSRATHKRYGLDQSRSYKILLLFEHRSIMNSTISRISAQGSLFANVQQYFLCKALEDIETEHFFGHWRTIMGDKRPFYS